MIAFFRRLIGLESRELYTQVLQLKQLLKDERRRVRYLESDRDFHKRRAKPENQNVPTDAFPLEAGKLD